MKILMIAPEPFFQVRGTPISVLSRLKTLSELNHTVDVATYHLGHDIAMPNVTIHRIIHLPWIKHIKIGPSYQKIILDLFLFIKAWNLLRRNKYEAIHTHEEAGFFGAIFSKAFKLPHIYDMHSSIPEQLVNYNFIKNGLLLRLVKLAERWTLSQSDVVIAICPHLKNIVMESGFKKEIMVIENIVLPQDKKHIAPQEIEKLKKELSLDDDALNIVYTGNFAYNQGIDLLIESMPLVMQHQKKVKFLLVGGETTQVEKFKEMADNLGVAKNVIFTGNKSITQMPLFAALADILVSPRKNGSNTPSKLYSYLMAGKPIVATRIPAHTQVVTEKEAMLTDATPRAFAHGILAIIRNETLGKSLGENAEKLFHEKCSYPLYRSKIQKVYDSLKNTHDEHIAH